MFEEISDYFLALAYVGFAISLMAFIPIYTKKIKITYIIPLLVMGAVIYWLEAPLPWPDPLWEFNFGKIVTEVIVIISLMTAGLKVGTNYTWGHWKKPLSLIVITMPLFMVAVFCLAHFVLGLHGAASLLLAAVLAPTDPVLASELQLEEHQDLDEKNTGLRYTLTAEAGINDGLAFPFVFLAILLSESGSLAEIDWWHFAWYYVLFKIVVGLMVGAVIGFIYSYAVSFHTDREKKYILKGFIALALTFFSYGLAEGFGTYGFLSVFATGVFMQYYRPADTDKNINTTMVHFIEETEKLLVALWTIFFGGAVMSGILSFTDWRGMLVALAIVVVVRPLFGYLAMATTNFSTAKKWAIGFFGIKGIGSFFYLSFALMHGTFEGYRELFGIVSYVVLFSIVIHGLTSLRVIDYFKRNNKG
ncbi:cation:proton antiporter [Marinirhabdus gelatinilytica]|uniref:Sodium/proton antiporter (CPA1 family) n=1 Tax=Marinirhabdus gelatinilytica TaxID=1703343 RepID=A0A370QAS2_9FLAO|nr:cation:proton antiporter [Marinirhabdus gelatinilytica]RDK85463.1 sodium/proton antiporter (CPA1 family) [Marinirhabdus gelatinilytica]